MAWKKTPRERIPTSEAHQLGLAHVTDRDVVEATPSRRSVIVTNAGGRPTGFTRSGQSWKVHEYDDQMGGHLIRRKASEAVPYEQAYAVNLQNPRPDLVSDRRRTVKG